MDESQKHLEAQVSDERVIWRQYAQAALTGLVRSMPLGSNDQHAQSDAKTIATAVGLVADAMVARDLERSHG